MTAKKCQNCYHADPTNPDTPHSPPGCVRDDPRYSSRGCCSSWAPRGAAGPWRTDEPPRDGSYFLVFMPDKTLALLSWYRGELGNGGWWAHSGLNRRPTRADIIAWAKIDLPTETAP